MYHDFTIIGGGVIGLATALELSRRGAKITILEREQVGREASWGGGGILSPLLPWDYPEPVTRLTNLSNALFPALVEELIAETGIDPEFVVSGMLVLPEFDAEKAGNWCRDNRYQLERVRSRRIASQLAIDVESLWLPQVAQVRTPRLLQALRRRLETLGVKIVENAEVTGWATSGRQVSAVVTARGEFSADGYIVTAGAWSRQVLGRLALALDIQPVRGQMLFFNSQPGLLTSIVLQNGSYLIPRKDGHILVGSTLEYVGYDKSTTGEARESLLSVACALLPQLSANSLAQHWAGLRPGSPQNIPVIARHPDLENLYLNSGHFRYGVTMAPGAARLLANMVYGLPQPIDASPYQWPLVPRP